MGRSFVVFIGLRFGRFDKATGLTTTAACLLLAMVLDLVMLEDGKTISYSNQQQIQQLLGVGCQLVHWWLFNDY